MKKINWLVRAKNKMFWMALIPAVLLLAQALAEVCGYSLQLGELEEKLLEAVNAGFTVLAILGIVEDPTTVGIADSRQAMHYIEPKK